MGRVDRSLILEGILLQVVKISSVRKIKFTFLLDKAKPMSKDIRGFLREVWLRTGTFIFSMESVIGGRKNCYMKGNSKK